MKAILSLLPLLIAGGCLSPTRLDSDPEANFHHIFGEVPERLKVINSTLRCAWWTSDNWEFELLAPADWIETQKHGLRRLEEKRDWDDDVHPGGYWRPRHASEWFAPGAPSAYEVWELHLTSIPYRHLYVEKASQGRELIHVYYRKD